VQNLNLFDKANSLRYDASKLRQGVGMRLIFLVGIMLTSNAFADFVYMQEDATSKSIQWYSAETLRTQALNDVTNKMWAIYPDISPDGKEFVYAEGPDGSDLHLTYTDSKKSLIQRFHLSQKGMLLHPKFTKNGKFIFYSAPAANGKNTIYFIDRAYEVTRQGETLSDFTLENATALDATEESYFPRPSSDGNFIVYQRNVTGKKEIVFFDRLENTKKVLAEGMSPALSFDERLIAYTSKKDGNWNIYIMDRVTNVVTQLTTDPADEQAPTFMPDNTLVFASSKGGSYRLYKLVKDQWVSLHQDESAIKGKDFYSPNFSGETKLTQGQKADYLGNPRSSFGTASLDGKVYMAGGHQGHEHTYPPESFSDSFIVYDIASNKWTDLAPRPVKAHGYQIAAIGNYVYAFGGFAYSELYKPKWKSLDQIDRYDIKNNRWETIGKLSTPRSSNVAVVIDGKVYLAGGWDSTPKFENDAEGKFLDSVEIFDLATEKVSTAAYKIPNPLRRALSGVAYQGQIILIGGLGVGSSHFELLDNVTAINPITGVVTELSKLPFATFAPAAEILNDELMVFGGMFQMGPMAYEYVSHIYALHLDQPYWRHTGRFLKETKGFSQVFKLSDETIGVLGGHHYDQGNDTPVSTFETIKTTKKAHQ
jgi:Tol biopolymer transport system component/N-acetylneuraminic acid mutarotase